MRGALVFVFLFAGCGAPPRAEVAVAPAIDESAVATWACSSGDEPPRTAAPRGGSQSLDIGPDIRPGSAPNSRVRAVETVRIERPVIRRVRRGPQMDVHLNNASLASAFRLLAEAAELGIVLGEGLDQTVTADLRRVRPVAAMEALAQAHGVELSMIGRTVVARRP